MASLATLKTKTRLRGDGSQKRSSLAFVDSTQSNATTGKAATIGAGKKATKQTRAVKEATEDFDLANF